MAAPKIMQQGRVVPWLYLLPALIVIAVFILYPTANTFQLSLRDRTGSQPATAECVEGEPCWGPFENYRYTLTSPEMLTALRNNALWILVMVPITIGIGLVIAVLADRVRYESLVKSIIFMPMAISFICHPGRARTGSRAVAEYGLGEQLRSHGRGSLAVGRLLHDDSIGGA